MLQTVISGAIITSTSINDKGKLKPEPGLTSSILQAKQQFHEFLNRILPKAKMYGSVPGLALE